MFKKRANKLIKKDEIIIQTSIQFLIPNLFTTDIPINYITYKNNFLIKDNYKFV